MLDPVKNNSNATDFSNCVKVPVEIYTKEKLGLLQINRAFVNFEILAAHLLKSNEWIYGIYFGPQYHGYIYQGEKLTLEQQYECVRDFLPQDRNTLTELQQTYRNRIEYHTSSADSFIIITDINRRTFGKLK